MVATKADLSKLSYNLQEGVYLVGSGNTGAAYALSCMGVFYTTILLASAFSIRYPHAEYKAPQSLKI